MLLDSSAVTYAFGRIKDQPKVSHLGMDLLRAIAVLDAKQKSQAILTSRVADLVLGPGQDGRVIQPEGIRGSALTHEQQTMMCDIVHEWVGIMTDAFAEPRMAEIKSHLNDTYFAWSGPTTNGSAAYFRIQGPTLLIEYAPQQGSVEHIHTITAIQPTTTGLRLPRNRTATIGVALFAALATTANLSAHRLDEYLQAARIAIEDDHVEIELGLTPGVAVADAMIAEVDRDRDGVLSSEEQHAYANGVTSALQLAIDERAIEMRLAGATFPDRAAMRTGDGTIQLRLLGTVAQQAGDHRLSFKNGNHAGGSVYLANALVPDSARIAVTAQNRDVDQREIAIDYTVRATESASFPFWIFGAIGAAAGGMRWMYSLTR